MFKPLPLFIGLRYTRAKRRNHFISFISLASMLGIAIGVIVLITVLSVMNGFDEQIRERVFGLAEQVGITTYDKKLPDWQQLDVRLAKSADVVATAPYAAGQGMLTHYGQIHPALIIGIEPGREAKIGQLANKMQRGSLSALQPGRYGIVVGRELAANLGLGIGDKVTVVIPTATLSPVGMIPRFKRFTVVGIFHAGTGFGFDDSLAYINMHDAQTLYQLGDNVTGLKFKLKDLYQAPQFANHLRELLPDGYIVTDWTETYGAFFQAVSLEKTMMFIILLLIIAVAVFNLVSSLVMVVTDKRSDIAILRTIGATPATILYTFIVQGFIIGALGTLLGLVGGLILASHVTELVNWLQAVFHVNLLSSGAFWVDYLPSKIIASDVIKICVSAFVMSLLATIYPAWRASRIQPAEALRYE